MTRRPNSRRPARFDDLGLRRALSDRLLPLLVAAMAFLAALALAGAVAAATLAQHWRQGAASALTVQVPQPSEAATGVVGSRIDAVLRLLRGTPGIADARALTEAQLADLLRPWLGATSESLALPLPAVIAVRLGDAGADLGSIAARLDHAAPGTLLESHDAWMQRLSALAHSLQICAGAAVLIVILVAAAVIATATRAGLATRRDAIEIVHGLGATDAYIAGRFARRITLLATLGAVGGALAALPVLLAMAGLAAPFASWGGGAPDSLAGAAAQLPPVIWLALPVLPMGAAAIGWLTTQGTVRAWLRQLP
jgi:cell division transport system permease protein